jgi:hypothetical protein
VGTAEVVDTSLAAVGAAAVVGAEVSLVGGAGGAVELAAGAVLEAPVDGDDGVDDVSPGPPHAVIRAAGARSSSACRGLTSRLGPGT